eukprot:TRINITY_DN5666_c0_g1_i1.p1 TRINITY_DN5666_c0_g1~~TRINITY_DN5666_c0_g1_i1.p1  ORF type:complete len:681 (-),score=102.51 TRINITY_DN5666_c0_g1_i1:93-2135(-)
MHPTLLMLMFFHVLVLLGKAARIEDDAGAIQHGFTSESLSGCDAFCFKFSADGASLNLSSGAPLSTCRQLLRSELHGGNGDAAAQKINADCTGSCRCSSEDADFELRKSGSSVGVVPVGLIEKQDQHRGNNEQHEATGKKGERKRKSLAGGSGGGDGAGGANGRGEGASLVASGKAGEEGRVGDVNKKPNRAWEGVLLVAQGPTAREREEPRELPPAPRDGDGEQGVNLGVVTMKSDHSSGDAGHKREPRHGQKMREGGGRKHRRGGRRARDAGGEAYRASGRPSQNCQEGNFNAYRTPEGASGSPASKLVSRRGRRGRRGDRRSGRRSDRRDRREKRRGFNGSGSNVSSGASSRAANILGNVAGGDVGMSSNEIIEKKAGDADNRAPLAGSAQTDEASRSSGRRSGGAEKDDMKPEMKGVPAVAPRAPINGQSADGLHVDAHNVQLTRDSMSEGSIRGKVSSDDSSGATASESVKTSDKKTTSTSVVTSSTVKTTEAGTAVATTTGSTTTGATTTGAITTGATTTEPTTNASNTTTSDMFNTIGLTKWMNKFSKFIDTIRLALTEFDNDTSTEKKSDLIVVDIPKEVETLPKAKLPIDVRHTIIDRWDDDVTDMPPAAEGGATNSAEGRNHSALAISGRVERSDRDRVSKGTSVQSLANTIRNVLDGTFGGVAGQHAQV